MDIARLAARALSTCFMLAVCVASCGGGNLASNLAHPPEYAPPGQAKCGVAKSQAHPLVVEWPSADRQELEVKIREGLVAVRYVGCEMDVLERCTVPAKYGYVGTTKISDRTDIENEDALYANLPVGAAKLEAELRKTGKLTVNMNLVGRYVADRPRVRADELTGDCEGATHFVYGATVGAFDFYAGADAVVGADGTVLGAGGGGHSKAQHKTLTADGDSASCAKATSGDKVPPENCGAIIRVEVVPLGEVKQAPATTGVAPSANAIRNNFIGLGGFTEMSEARTRLESFGATHDYGKYDAGGEGFYLCDNGIGVRGEKKVQAIELTADAVPCMKKARVWDSLVELFGKKESDIVALFGPPAQRDAATGDPVALTYCGGDLSYPTCTHFILQKGALTGTMFTWGVYR